MKYSQVKGQHYKNKNVKAYPEIDVDPHLF
jgi:hypothetical protein